MIHRSSLSLMVHTNNKLRRHRNISTRKVKYGFKLSGCNILNNVGYLMTRNQYDIKGSIFVNHHMQKLHFVDKYQSISLSYTEGILPPSLNWKPKDEKCSIIGAISSSLLNLCCIQEGFNSMQQHICARLNSPSNAMGSDPRYIYHCYDITEHLAASCNNTRLVIKRYLTVIVDKHVNLGVKGSGDSSILGSVDIRQTVKNFAHQKNTYLEFFLNFYSKPKQIFGTKFI